MRISNPALHQREPTIQSTEVEARVVLFVSKSRAAAFASRKVSVSWTILSTAVTMTSFMITTHACKRLILLHGDPDYILCINRRVWAAGAGGNLNQDSE